MQEFKDIQEIEIQREKIFLINHKIDVINRLSDLLNIQNLTKDEKNRIKNIMTKIIEIL